MRWLSKSVDALVAAWCDESNNDIPDVVVIGSGAGVLLTIPVDDNDPSLARTFNDLLARAYVYSERDGVKALLRSRGLTTITPPTP